MGKAADGLGVSPDAVVVEVPCQATFTITTASSSYAVARAEQTDGDQLVAAPIWLTP